MNMDPGNRTRPRVKNATFSIIKTLFFIGFFLILSGSRLPATDGSHHLIKAWMIEDGLPQNSITAIHQARNGYLWLGTPLGVIRFNGTTFPIHNIWNTRELKNNHILTLYDDPNGRLWVGTDGGGISLFQDNRWRLFKANSELLSQRVQKIFQDSAGILWFGTSRGLHRLENRKIIPIPLGRSDPHPPVKAICEDSAGNLWVGTEKGLVVKQRARPGHGPRFRPLNGEPVSALCATGREDIWIGTEKGLKRFSDNRITIPFPREPGLASVSITALFHDNNGNLWVGTYGEGLYQIKDGKPIHFSTASGMSDNFIQTITQDREENLWVGTFTGGLIRLKPRVITTLDTDEGLPENTITCVMQDPEGILWIGTRHRGLCRFKNRKLETIYSTENGLASNRINTLFQTKSGETWVGTEKGGLSRISNDRIKTYTTSQGMRSNTVKAICQDHSGILWIGTPNGLNGFINETFITREELDGYAISTIFEDSRNRLWVGSRRGLSLIKPETITHVAANREGAHYDVLGIFESGAQPGVIWIGTNGVGLLRLENGKITHYTEENGLYSNFVFSLTQTGKEGQAFLWMSCYKGIFRVSLDDLNRFARGETGTITSTFFNESDGMTSSECVARVQPAIWKTVDETIYVPTIKGLAVLRPEAIAKGKQKIPVIIEDVIIDNQSYLNQKNPRITSGKRMFEFYFAALNYTSPRNTQFRYKLEGFENRWTTLMGNEKPTALYFNLSPGNYRFRVIACNYQGQWNREGAHFDFRIQSDLKESLLVYIPRILIILVFLAGFLVWRVRKKKPRKKKYQTSALTSEQADDIQNKLLAIMEGEEIYLDPDLTLKKLSEKIMVHPNHLSRIVNENFGQSFNDFINKYRIERAKQKFTDPEESEKTILEIAYDVGFYSKSVFNTAFKKFTGMTPSGYREKIRR